MIKYQELTGDDMKNKIMLVVLSIFLMFLIACQQAAKTETAATVPTAGDAAVDSIGSGLNNTDNVAKDLNTDDLSSLDSSLSDMQNI